MLGPSFACADFQKSRWTRRQLLQVGGLTTLGLSLPSWLRAAANTRKQARVEAVIFLHQWGGPSHLDTVDPKPNAPAEVRGEFRAVPTSAPGVMFTDQLPRLGKVANRLCVIRTMTHRMKNHNSAGYYSLTGHAPPTDDQRLRDSLDLFPAYGSVVDYFLPAKPGVPTFVAFPHVIADGSVTPGQHASFLGRKHDPFFVGQDPNRPDFRLPELTLPAGLTLERLEDRRQVLRLIDQQRQLLEYSATARGMDEYYQRAVALLTSPKVREAFDLSKEPASVRDRYGRTTYGQSCLLARRLVEVGVRFINVYFSANIGGQGNTGGWDTHGFNGNPMYPILKGYLLPITDQTLPTLIEDLESRGLLKTTLVVWAGEFGRTPRINNNAGRDHWPECYSVILAGGGVKGGFVYGVSDRYGAWPSANPVKPDDLAATMFAALGLDPHAEVYDPLNRPLMIATGRVIEEIFA
ncbi:MAG: DUF1501 domain-containing protein [Gemmatales bacterium]|nr:DUF1501 domain-containing protein [Gemmatales bacterium]